MGVRVKPVKPAPDESRVNSTRKRYLQTCCPLMIWHFCWCCGCGAGVDRCGVGGG